MCHGTKCSLRFCSYRSEPALGHSRQKPSVRGRDKREAEYARLHPICEVAGCGRATRATHHQGGRGLGGWRRKTAPLFACCHDHHEALHRGVPV